MRRAFRPDAVDDAVLGRVLATALRAPSAGNSQGWHFVVLTGAQTAVFWDRTLPPERRSGFRWPGLLTAPVLVLPFADPTAYTTRYAESDKAATGLGAGAHAWPVPYWTVDTAMAVQLLLLAAHDEGLGALFFAVFRAEREVRSALGVPDHLELLGAVALGHPAPDEPGRSAARPRRPLESVVHRGRWRPELGGAMPAP